MLQSSTQRFIIGSVVAVSLALTAGPADADKCTSKKLKAIAKKEAGLLKCQAKVALKGDPSLAAACNTKVMTRFSTAFGKAGACAGVEADCETIGDALRDPGRAALPDGTTLVTASKCESKRLKAAARKAKSKLGCYAKAALKDVPVDAAPGGCLDKASSRFAQAFDKVTGCTGDGPRGTVQGLLT